MTKFEYLVNIMDSVEDSEGDHEPGYITQWPSIRDNLNDADGIEKQDKRYIQAGKMFAQWITDEYMNIEDTDAWHWHIARIASGEYPLDDLPEHVRELARELYYD